MSSLSRATRSSRGKGKPQLTSFVQGSPVAACYRPPVPATGPRLLVTYKRLRSEDFLRRPFLPVFCYESGCPTLAAVILSSPTLRTTVCGRPSPLPPHAEDVKLGVIAEHGHIFMKCLSSKHPVKGVFVVSGQKAGSHSVFRRDGEQQVA